MNMCFVQDADLEPKVAPWLIDKYICLLITFRLVTSVTSYVAVVTNDAVCTQGRIMCETRYVRVLACTLHKSLHLIIFIIVIHFL